MRILACSIANFGKHHNIKFTLNDGFNIMNAENGWGKSTFAAFIRVMFYGMAQKKRSDKYDRTDYRKNYYPWQGGKFGGSITFEYRGKEYHLERYFGESIREDTCRVIDLQTMQFTREFGTNIGETIFGIDSEGFERSIYIPHNEMDVVSNDSINSRLMGLIEDRNDMSNFERAMSALEDARKDLKKTGGRGKIDIDRSRIDEDRIKLREKQNMLAMKHKLETELENIEAVKSEAESTMERSDAGLKELHEENRKRLGHNVPLVAGVVFVLAGIGSVFLSLSKNGETAMAGRDSLTWAIIAAGCIFAGLIFILFKIMMSGRYRGAVRATTETASAARKTFTDAVASEAGIRLKLEELDHELMEADELKHSIDTMEAGQEKDNERLNLILKTMDFLNSAKNTLAVSYMGKMRQNFEKYISKVLGGDQQVAMDSDFNITVMKSGSYRNIQNQSTGTQDMINLCARFALIDSLYEDEKPCVILDDVLSNLDDSNYERAMQAIEKLSESFQVMYLTCHSARAATEKQ